MTSWIATGHVRDAWKAVGGRDRLAELTGIQAATLSGYNTGRLRLGVANARRIALATGVTVFDLGAPAGAAETQDEQSVLDRLAELEAALNRLGPSLEEVGGRVTALEKQAPPRKRRGGSNG